ncbi:HlyD family efflux transporter periplasmic adaptor subunit [Oceanobacillus polygoni]|uniref:HlyD family secretion protein n=2 Tax=Oceanobacillus polygoni TaxID=1235259 RepID=A0A9X1CJY5_9BACI|nr:HlyD family efflux transporter periplasmic adaptor subunit [Oceanobacillus polygoni]MBP2079077.1 HlyD family secretion protein [Oceanobacillus polygoni]
MRKRMVPMLMALFIGVNFLLVFLDDEGKVERTSYVNEWTKSFEKDMTEKLYKPGVLHAVGEEHVYFDNQLGSFQQFLVEEGEQVNVGDGLYTYLVHDYYEMEANLMNQADQIQGEISAIEQAISQMEMYQIPSDELGSPHAVTITEELIEVEYPQTSIDADLLKEQFRVEKELELSQKNAQLQTINNQLVELRATGDTITVESPYEGTISQLHVNLDDPVITIQNNDVLAVGELTEQERVQMEERRVAEVAVHEIGTRLDGVIEEVSKSPTEIEIAKESIYPFQVAFEVEDEADELLPGYHVDIVITMEESLGATVLFEEAIFTDAVWKMTNEGKIAKENIERGLHVDEVVEVADGVEQGEFIAVKPSNFFQHDAHFITPLRTKQLTGESFSDANWLEHFVTGLLSR